MANKHIFAKSEIKDIIDLYVNDLKSMTFISKKYHIDKSTIKRVLKENNIEIRDNNIYKEKSFNQNYFKNISTEAQAYWLGFLWGDGSIHTNKLNQYCISLNLSINDKFHLENFKKALNSNHKITISKNKYGYLKNSNAVHYSCKYCLRSIKMYNDLINLGVRNPKKDRTIPNIESSLMSHFIRGYFDADGSLSYSKTNNGIVSFCGPIEIIQQIKLIIQQICNTKAEIYKYKNRNAADYRIGGKNNLIDLYNYLYKDATIYLKRKKDKWDSLVEVLNGDRYKNIVA